MSIRVVIAEDMLPIQKKMVMSLNSDPNIEVVGTASSGYEAVIQAALTKPDILLTDIEMAEKSDGLDAIVQILENLPETKVVILTVHEDDHMIFKAYEYGVSDYILKNADKDELIQRIKNAYNNHSDISFDIAKKITNEFKRIRHAEQNFTYCINLIMHLTPAEISLLKLFADGKSRREICEIKTVELSTIKSQVNSILKKTHQKNIKDLLNIIQQNNIFSMLNATQ